MAFVTLSWLLSYPDAWRGDSLRRSDFVVMAHRVSDRLSLWKDFLLLQGARCRPPLPPHLTAQPLAVHTASAEVLLFVRPRFTVCRSVPLTHLFNIRPPVSPPLQQILFHVRLSACLPIHSSAYLSFFLLSISLLCQHLNQAGQTKSSLHGPAHTHMHAHTSTHKTPTHTKMHAHKKTHTHTHTFL